MMELRQLGGGAGWALHALVLDFADGHRSGQVLANDGGKMGTADSAFFSRGGRWTAVPPGAYVVDVSGAHLARGTPAYLCYEITFTLENAERISFSAHHAEWRGEPFRYELPPDTRLSGVRFAGGRCVGIDTVALVLPPDITVHVRTLDGEVFKVEVASRGTTLAAKRCVHEVKRGFPVHQQQLRLGGDAGFLDDRQTLAAAGVADGMTLHLVVDTSIPEPPAPRTPSGRRCGSCGIM